MRQAACQRNLGLTIAEGGWHPRKRHLKPRICHAPSRTSTTARQTSCNLRRP